MTNLKFIAFYSYLLLFEQLLSESPCPYWFDSFIERFDKFVLIDIFYHTHPFIRASKIVFPSHIAWTWFPEVLWSDSWFCFRKYFSLSVPFLQRNFSFGIFHWNVTFIISFVHLKLLPDWNPRLSKFVGNLLYWFDVKPSSIPRSSIFLWRFLILSSYSLDL